MKPVAAKQLRCALYTRVSTDHGLEQEFNSLDNQREAAAAYVKSQAHEGWRPVRERYDDGGFSGGSLDRPALRRLLADIAARRVDIVVVYKVDRLTRSLADFAKLVELFDAHGVSFVSVTQSFNTTSSMGRLTLNVLLSFAQFEREVTGERIRDKIAASKRKGIWVGGIVPLGYALQDRKLVVDDHEAATVRMIFERYLALGSLPALQRELKERGIVTRERTMSSGGIRGGVPLTNGPLAYMLRNRFYLGELNHRGESYPAEHPAIIDADLFRAVQARLDGNRQATTTKRHASGALLLGLLYDDRGNRMGPSHANKNGVRYRYYVSAATVQGRTGEAGSVARVAADQIETAVLDALRTAGHDLPDEPSQTDLTEAVERVVVRPDRLEITLVSQENGAPAQLVVDWVPRVQRQHRAIIGPTGSDTRPIRAEARSRLLDGIARARSWLDDLMAARVDDLDALATRDGMSLRSARMQLSLAFLAPDIVQAAVEGTLPRGFGLSRLTELPPSWTEQRHVLGLAG